VLGTRGMGEAGDFWIEWGLLFWYFVVCYFVILLFVESKKACFVSLFVLL